MAKNTPAFQFYPTDFMGGVLMLSDEACGVYMKLLSSLWVQGNLLPMDEFKLSKAAMTTVDVMQRVWPEIKDKFVVDEATNEISHARFSKMMDISKARQETGRLGGQVSSAQAVRSSGYIYLAKRISSGRTKIGLSRTPKKRISALRGRHGDMETIEIIEVADMDSAEKVAHAICIEYREKGEWFSIPDDILPSIIVKIKKELKEKIRSSGRQAPPSGGPEEIRVKSEDRSMKNKEQKKGARNATIPGSLGSVRGFARIWILYCDWWLSETGKQLDAIKGQFQLESLSRAPHKAVADLKLTMEKARQPGTIWDSDREQPAARGERPNRREELKRKIQEAGRSDAAN